MFGYVSGFFSDETEGIRSRSLALKKSCSMPQLSILFNTASVTKARLLIPKKKIKNVPPAVSKREKILYPGMRKPQSPQPLPLPSSFLLGDKGLSPLIPNATLGPLALRCCGGSGWDVGLAAATAAQEGGLAGRPPRCQTPGLCSGCHSLAVAAGGKAVFWVCPGQPELRESPSWSGARSKVSMSLA